jgi:hypothetical protein
MDFPASNTLIKVSVIDLVMSKSKIIFIAGLIVGLTCLSFYINRDAFAPETIQISHRLSPWMRPATPGARRGNDLGMPVTFSMNGSHPLKSVKVVLVADATTNKYPHAIWKLVSDSNSVATTSFNYGAGIRGMRPETKGIRPDALEPGVAYRLIVETAKDKIVQHDFSVGTNR